MNQNEIREAQLLLYLKCKSKKFYTDNPNAFEEIEDLCSKRFPHPYQIIEDLIESIIENTVHSEGDDKKTRFENAKKALWGEPEKFYPKSYANFKFPIREFHASQLVHLFETFAYTDNNVARKQESIKDLYLKDGETRNLVEDIYEEHIVIRYIKYLRRQVKKNQENRNKRYKQSDLKPRNIEEKMTLSKEDKSKENYFYDLKKRLEKYAEFNYTQVDIDRENHLKAVNYYSAVADKNLQIINQWIEKKSQKEAKYWIDELTEDTNVMPIYPRFIPEPFPDKE